MSARGCRVKRSECSNRLDTALYKNVPLPFSTVLTGEVGAIG